MKSRRLPSYRPTSAVLRAGVERASTEALIKQAALLARAAYTWSETKLQQRVISVPELQMEKLKYHLRVHDMHGFYCLPRPDDGTFGEDQEFNERHLIENPGKIVLTDADFGFSIENPQASFKLTPLQWGAEFEDSVQLADYHGTKLSGCVYRQTQGYFVGRQNIAACVNNVEQGFRRSAANQDISGFFFRNFFVLDREAKGTWSAAPLLEDLYRSLSEYAHDPESLGRYYGTRVRFPDGRTNKDYRDPKNPKHLDWLEGKRLIDRDFPELVKYFVDVFEVKRKRSPA